MHTELYQDLTQEQQAQAAFSSQSVSRFSPIEIRQTISQLVAEDRLDLAHALCEAGLAIHPDSEDVLAIAGLLAMLREDFSDAAGILNHLMVVQGESAPITSHVMFIRALRCAGEPVAALRALMLAHEQHPNHPDLQAEFEQLSQKLGIKAAD
jgi:uncharacterized protein HemY